MSSSRSSTRRSLLAAGVLTAAPATALAAWGKPKAAKGCQGRESYAGPTIHPLLRDDIFARAAKAGATRTHPVIHDDLEDALAKAAGAMKTQALTAAVALPAGDLWTQTLAPTLGRRAAPERFFWGSIGKAYTATAVLQLIEERKLSLDATLDRWAPDMPNARWITIEDLLCHVSGLYSFQNDPALRAEPGYEPPERLLAAARAQAPGFCPGAAWSYSNTGYVLLGQIIEALDAKPYHESLKVRIVDRLGLEQTTILAPRQQLAGLAQPVATPGQAAADDLTTPFAAGAVAASSPDVVRFWRALMANRLHGAAVTQGRFYRSYPMVGVSPASFYGQGIMITDLALADPKATDTWLGHAGGLPGAKAMVAYSAEKAAFVAVALTGEGSPEATANLLLAALPRA